MQESSILPGWVGVDAAGEASDRLGLPVEVENDANLGALAEYVWGAAKGRSDLVYIKVSSGIGAGLISGGRLQHGVSGTAGEIGHMVRRGGRARCAAVATAAASRRSRRHARSPTCSRAAAASRSRPEQLLELIRRGRRGGPAR